MHSLEYTPHLATIPPRDRSAAQLHPERFRSHSAKIFSRLSLLFLFSSGIAHGISYYQIGNSLTYDSYPFNGAFASVANNNSQSVTDTGWHIRPGEQLNYIHANPDDAGTLTGPSGNWQSSLTSHAWDAITFQPFYGGTSTLGTDTLTILDWIDLATRNASPNATFYLYAAWPRRSDTSTYSEQWLGSATNDDSQPTVLNRQYFVYLLERIRNDSQSTPRLIPVGHVWFHIEELINSGVITELNSAYDLYRDAYHANDIGKSVIAWTLYASFFHKSAVGVSLGDTYSLYADAPVVMDRVLAFKLQHAVDDVVFSPRADTNSDGIPDEDSLRLGLSVDSASGDTDHDGKSDLVEVGRDVNNPIDTDGDGVIDAIEPDPADIDPSLASQLRLANGQTLSIRTSSGEMLSQVRISNIAHSLPGIEFPFGMISYLTTAPSGGSIQTRLEFSTDLEGNLALYKVDHMGNFTGLPESAWTRSSARSLTLTLTDADSQTDLDGMRNGIIDDPVAIGVLPQATSGPSVESTSTGGGCTLARNEPGIDLISAITALLLGISRRPTKLACVSPES